MSRKSTKPSSLLNLGPKSDQWLGLVGIHTSKDLQKVGPAKAYLLCKEAGFNTSKNLLWALAGALTGIRWNELPDEMKEQLLGEVDTLSA